MKFFCDNCQAQYMISDEKVGPAGVRVRCKKCSHVIFVKRLDAEVVPEDSTVVVSQEKMAQLSTASVASRPGSSPASDPPATEPPLAAEAASNAPEGLEDEIGQALDSMFSDTPPPAGGPAPPPASMGSRPPVVLGASPLSRGPSGQASPFGALDSGRALGADQADPRAFNPELTQLAAVNPSGVSPPPAVSKAVEWFIAVRDEQVGPLQVEEIKQRFERGEVGSDTLVWSTGLTDWRALSNVEELAELIIPKRDIVRASSRIPIPAEPPKEPVKKEPIAFRPSAASALASLASMAKEEIAATEKGQVPVLRPPESAFGGVSETMPAKFLGELPAPSPAAILPSLAKPAAASPAVDEAPEPSSVAYRRSPLAQSKPRRRGLRPAVVVGIGLGVFLLLVGLAAATYAFVIKPQREFEVRLEQEQRDEAKRQKDDAEKVRQDALAAAQAAALAAQKAAAVPPAAVQPPAPQPVARGPAPEPALRQDASHDKRGNKRGKGGKTPVETPALAAANPPAAHVDKPAGAKGSDDFLAAGDVDKEFAKELDGSGESGKASTKHGPYIPPPPGQGDLPVTLSQSDIVGAVTQHRDAFARCVQDQKRRDPSASGTVVMRWRIRPDGRSTDIAAKGEDYADSPLAGCFKGQIAKLHFGAYRGAQMAPIEFPFSF